MSKAFILESGVKVQVAKFKVFHIRKIAKLISHVDTGDFSQGSLDYTKLCSLIDENFDDIVDIIASCTNLSADEIENLDIVDIINLLKNGIYEVNKDFLGKFLVKEE